MRSAALVLLVCSGSVLGAEYSHNLGLSMQYDEPAADETYGLSYQLGINENWVINAAYYKGDNREAQFEEREVSEYINRFNNLGISYQTDNYYIDLQLLAFSDKQTEISIKPKVSYKQNNDGYGLALGAGLFHDWDDWALEYGVSLIGQRSDLFYQSREKTNSTTDKSVAESELQQVSSNFGIKLSYFYPFEDWALIPMLSLSWNQKLSQNEEQKRYIQNKNQQKTNLMRKGLRYSGFINSDNSGVLNLGVDLLHYQGLSFSLSYSTGIATDYQIDSWLIGANYAF